jgi:hypothetical protein
LTGGHFLEADMLTQVLPLIDKVVNCESIDEPFAHRVALYVATVFYIVAPPFIVLNRNLKEFFDSYAPTVESAGRNTHLIFTKKRATPTTINLVSCNVTC